jgi:hypothetical protein
LDGTRSGAFYSDCRSWETNPLKPLFFGVQLRNISQKIVTISFRNILLSSRDGTSFGPVRLEGVTNPTTMFPKRLRLTPGRSWDGFVAFDGRVQHMIPAYIDYVDGKQTLRQVFAGRYAVVGRG